MKIRVGFGINGDIYADLDKAKACNFCTHFKGYGLHACTGRCLKLDKDIDGGYIGNYNKVAKECNDFNVRPELIENPHQITLEGIIKTLESIISEEDLHLYKDLDNGLYELPCNIITNEKGLKEYLDGLRKD